MGRLKVTLTKEQYNKGFENCKEYVLLHTGWELWEYAYAARGAAKAETAPNDKVLGLEMTALDYALSQEEKQYLEWEYSPEEAHECAKQSVCIESYCVSFYLKDTAY